MDYKFIAHEIKSIVTMADICEQYGIKVERSNKALCPFHADEKPSMHVYNGSGGFHCFACGAHGDVIWFVQQMEGIAFRDACKKINADFHLGLPIDRPASLREYFQREEYTRKRDAEEEHRQRLNEEYLDALDRYSHYDCMVRDKRPRTMQDDPCTEWLEALRMREQAGWDLQIAEWRLINND